MPPQLTDGLILGALLTILAWLFARAVSRKDSPDYGSDDLYLARITRIILAERQRTATRKGRGERTASSSGPRTKDASHKHHGRASR